jgi:hypothetical protein
MTSTDNRNSWICGLALAGAVLMLLGLLGCQAGPPAPMPPLRERNYNCQQLGPGDTQEDEVLCETNKHPFR